MYNNRYMRSEPLMDWSQPVMSEREELPKKLTKFLELYDNGCYEFGYDPHERALEMIEMVKDLNPDIDSLDDLASIAIADSF